MTSLRSPVLQVLAATAFSVLAAALPASPTWGEGALIRATSQTKPQFLALGKGKSIAIDLPRDAKDVLVANPAIANAVVRSARRAFLIGVEHGQTNIVFFDTNGEQIAAFNIEVGRDVAGLQEAIRRVVPSAKVRADQVQDSIVLSGSVASAAEAQQIVDIAIKLAGDEKKVVNGLTIRAKEQVMLRVVVAEVKREVVKQFGINLEALNGGISVGSSVIDFAAVNPWGLAGKALSSTDRSLAGSASGSGAYSTIGSGSRQVKAAVEAMERAGVMRTLAEPNLTAISGESAKFLAGGEYPFITGYTYSSGYTVEWKPFGVLLDFTPIVLSEGRISLRLMTEVSEISTDNKVQISTGLTLSGINVRRASSTLELPSGGSLVLGGLIKEETKQTINGTPGLQNVPILGTLFRSRDFQNNQSELLIIVTPYIVNPVARKQLQTPDEGLAPASDPSTIFLGRLNRTYGVAGKLDPRRPYHGTYGFIID